MSSQTPSLPSTSAVTHRRRASLEAPGPPGPVPGLRALQRTGGLAALVTAGTYLVGLVVLGACLAPRGYLDAQGDPAASLEFLIGDEAVLYGWYLVLCLVGGVALISVVLALPTRLAASAPALAATGAAFGLL